MCIYLYENTSEVSGISMDTEINFVNNVGGSSVLFLRINTITPSMVTELANTLQTQLLDHFMLNGKITDSVDHILQIFASPQWSPFLTADRSVNFQGANVQNYGDDSLNRDYREWYFGNNTTNICITTRGIQGDITHRVASRTDRRGFFYLSLTETDSSDILGEALSNFICSN